MLPVQFIQPPLDRTDFADTAGLIAHVDLVISVDTSTGIGLPGVDTAPRGPKTIDWTPFAAAEGVRCTFAVSLAPPGADPVQTRRGLPGDAGDAQSRYLEAAVDGILVGCLYAPNGNPQPGPKFDYKLAWLERFIAHAAQLHASGHPVVLAGDYNVVPTDFDIYDPRSWKKDALLQPEPRARYQRLLAQGWVDALREKHPEERIYTFWDYFRRHWERDAGLHIDHLLIGKGLKLLDAGVDRWVRGRPHASDHAPAWVTLEKPRPRP